MRNIPCKRVRKTSEVGIRDAPNLCELELSNIDSIDRAKLDGDLVSPLPLMPPVDPQQSTAVFAAQLNLIEGGLLLCAAFHHSVFDGSGFATVLKMWANATKLGPQPCPSSFGTNDLDRGQISGNRCLCLVNR